MSRRMSGLKPAVCLLSVLAGLSSCDWSGGSGSDFNTSRGGLNINLSGFYRGVGSGGRAVSATTGGNKTNFTIQQSGNVLEVTDNNGQKYRGNVGSPLAVATPSTLGVIPTGAQLANFQVNWSGKDGTAGKNIQFTGVVNVVAVTDIRASTSRQLNVNDTTATNTATDNQTGGSVNNNQTTTTVTNNEGVNGSQTVSTGPGGGTATETFTDSTGTTQTITTGTNNSNTSTVNATTTNTSQDRTSSATESTFALGDANTQYRMRGTWIENGGVVGNVDAISPGAGGVLVVLATGQNASNITTPTAPTTPTLP